MAAEDGERNKFSLKGCGGSYFLYNKSEMVAETLIGDLWILFIVQVDEYSKWTPIRSK